MNGIELARRVALSQIELTCMIQKMKIESPEEHESFLGEMRRINEVTPDAAPVVSTVKSLPAPVMALPGGSKVLTSGNQKKREPGPNKKRFQAEVIAFLKQHPGQWIGNKTLYEGIDFKQPPQTRSNCMRELVDNGIVEKIGYTTNTQYRIS